MKKKYRFPWWLTTILLGLVGWIVGYTYSRLYNEGWFAVWEYLGTTPDKPARFLSIEPVSWEEETADFVIETSSGEAYRYKWQNHAWEKVDTSPADHPSVQPMQCDYESGNPEKLSFSRLPGKISLCSRIDWTWEWFGNTDYYVILEDNSVWTWAWRSSPVTAVSFWGWDEITAICVGWTAIWFIRRGRGQTNKRVAIAYWFLGICLTIAVFVLLRAAAPAASNITLVALVYLFMYKVPRWLVGAVLAVLALIVILISEKRSAQQHKTTQG